MNDNPYDDNHVGLIADRQNQLLQADCHFMLTHQTYNVIANASCKAAANSQHFLLQPLPIQIPSICLFHRLALEAGRLRQIPTRKGYVDADAYQAWAARVLWPPLGSLWRCVAAACPPTATHCCSARPVGWWLPEAALNWQGPLLPGEPRA